MIVQEMTFVDGVERINHSHKIDADSFMSICENLAWYLNGRKEKILKSGFSWDEKNTIERVEFTSSEFQYSLTENTIEFKTKKWTHIIRITDREEMKENMFELMNVIKLDCWKWDEKVDDVSKNTGGTVRKNPFKNHTFPDIRA